MSQRRFLTTALLLAGFLIATGISYAQPYYDSSGYRRSQGATLTEQIPW